MEDGCFQFRVIGQHCIAEPLTVQRIGDPLWADIAERPVKSETASIVIIAAAAVYQLSCLLVPISQRVRFQLVIGCQLPKLLNVEWG